MPRLLILIVLLLTFSSVAAAEDSFIEGQHYERISPAVKTATTDGIEIVEVFWYGCPHCFDFEPHINEWVGNKADDINFKRMPAIFNKSWVPHARAYYTAEILGVLDRIHPELFKALHEKRQQIMTEESIKQFFIDNGVSKEDFDTTYNSFAVDTKTRQAVAATKDYGITGVPAIIVNGRYWTSARLTGDFEGMLKATDHLAAKERAR